MAQEGSSFTVAVERQGAAVVARPQGELDIATVPRLREAIERTRSNGEPLVLDLSGLSFTDTSGMRFVIEQHEQGGLTVVRGGPAIQRILELAGLDRGLRFVDSVDEAVAD